MLILKSQLTQVLSEQHSTINDMELYGTTITHLFYTVNRKHKSDYGKMLKPHPEIKLSERKKSELLLQLKQMNDYIGEVSENILGHDNQNIMEILNSLFVVQKCIHDM